MKRIVQNRIVFLSRRGSVLRATVLAAVILLPVTAWGQVFLFDPAVNYIVGDRVADVAAGDFDQDGDWDLAATSDNPDKVSILLNDGAGAFTAGPIVFLPGGSGAGHIVAGNLDGDTDVDLAVALQNNNGVMVLINSGGANFAIAGTFATGMDPRGMDIGDLDGDNDLDLVVANRDSNNATILTNSGSASFTTANVAVGNDPRDAAFGDFDGDNDLDAAVTNHDDRTISILTNTGGVFAVSNTLSVGGQVRPEGITAADLDGDLDIDIAAATNEQDPPLNNATVFVNTAGSFSGPFHYATGGVDTSAIIAADFDCDPGIDLATANMSSNDVSVLPNLGGAVFGAATVLSVGTAPEELTAADLDGDGDEDLAVANRDSNNVSVMINQTCEPAIPGDLNGDGCVDQADLGILLTDWGCTGGDCAGDIDGNGDTDQSDLGILLTNWGIGCP